MDDVTADEAREIAQRFIDGHFRNEGKEGPRVSIPANPRRDDDLRLLAFIERVARAEGVLADCEDCDGKGRDADDYDCEECSGAGTVRVVFPATPAPAEGE